MQTHDHTKQNPLVFLFKKMWHYSAGNRGRVVLYFTFFTVANILFLLMPFVVAKILNAVQETGISRETLPTLLLSLSFFIVLQLGSWLFHGPARVLENANAFLVRAAYKQYLLDGTMSLPVGWHSDHHSGDTIDKIEKGSEALFNFSRWTFEVFRVLMSFTVSYVILIRYNVHASYIVALMVMLTFAIIFRFDKTLVAQLTALYKKENAISAKIFDIVSNITTVLILRIEKRVSKQMRKKIMEPFALYNKESRLNEWKWFFVSLCGSVTLVLVLSSYFVTEIITGGVILIGSVYLLYQYAENVVNTFYSVAWMYGGLLEQKTAVMNAEALTKEFTAQVQKKDDVRMPEDWTQIEVKNLRFSYHAEDNADMHLDGVSFTLRKGEKIAFIGESGSGKTTAMKIIRGLYTPKRCVVLLDGVRLPHGFESISSKISLIPQEPEIFSTTVKENITIGIPHSLEYIRRFTNMAEFTRVAERLPKTFNSSIVEKGVNLSGGEKQRLALARGLMASVDKEIILLDEPTSSVDSKNERRIYEHILRAFKDQTIISSIHRLHLLPLFDTVYLFRDGKITAQGTFEELLASSPAFQQLWEKYTSAQQV